MKNRLPSSVTEQPSSAMEKLREAILQLPAEHHKTLLPTLEKVNDTLSRRQRILALVQESSAQLRLDVKYLMFDLDCTRQERDTLAHELDDRRSGN